MAGCLSSFTHSFTLWIWIILGRAEVSTYQWHFLLTSSTDLVNIKKHFTSTLMYLNKQEIQKVKLAELFYSKGSVLSGSSENHLCTHTISVQAQTCTPAPLQWSAFLWNILICTSYAEDSVWIATISGSSHPRRNKWAPVVTLELTHTHTHTHLKILRLNLKTTCLFTNRPDA